MGLYGPAAKGVDIAGISAAMQPTVDEWFNAEIEIVDPDITGGTYNRATNSKTGRNPTVLWSGKARIQALRWPNVATARNEAVALRTVAFHIPLDSDLDPEMIREGFRVRVTDGGMAPYFEDGLFVITSSVNTSYAWDRRIETVQDQGVG